MTGIMYWTIRSEAQTLNELPFSQLLPQNGDTHTVAMYGVVMVLCGLLKSWPAPGFNNPSDFISPCHSATVRSQYNTRSCCLCLSTIADNIYHCYYLARLAKQRYTSSSALHVLGGWYCSPLYKSQGACDVGAGTTASK